MADDVTFDEPEGFVPPENLDEENSFQAMCTLKVLPNNQLQLVDVEGYQIGEGDQEQEEEQEPGAGEAAPPPPAGSPMGGGAPGPNMSADQLAPGGAGQQTAGYAERLGQAFRKATRRR